MSTEAPFIIYQSRTYRLYKKGNTEKSPWIIRVQVSGKRVAVTTGTTDDEQAKARALLIVQDAVAGQWSKVEDHVNPHGGKRATFGQVMKIKGRDYCARLVTLVTESTGNDSIDNLPVDILTPALVAKFQAARQGLKGRPNYETPMEANKAANNVLRYAKAVFSKAAMAAYEKQGLNMPNMKPFLEARYLADVTWRYSDEPLKPAVLKAITKAMPALKLQAPAVWREHTAVATEGAAEASDEYTEWLERHGAKPEQVRWHAGEVWLRRTGSLHLVAEKLACSYATAHWHLDGLNTKTVRLSFADVGME